MLFWLYFLNPVQCVFFIFPYHLPIQGRSYYNFYFSAANISSLHTKRPRPLIDRSDDSTGHQINGVVNNQHRGPHWIQRTRSLEPYLRQWALYGLQNPIVPSFRVPASHQRCSSRDSQCPRVRSRSPQSWGKIERLPGLSFVLQNAKPDGSLSSTYDQISRLSLSLSLVSTQHSDLQSLDLYLPLTLVKVISKP